MDSPNNTIWPCTKTLNEELELVEKEDSELLRIYLSPLVALMGKQFLDERPNDRLPDQVFEAAFMYLPFAIRKYKENLTEGKVEFKFSKYYAWFMRQGFSDYPFTRVR